MDFSGFKQLENDDFDMDELENELKDLELDNSGNFLVQCLLN